MNPRKLSIITAGIQVKLNRGEELEDILSSYTKLSEEEKNQIRSYFSIE